MGRAIGRVLSGSECFGSPQNHRQLKRFFVFTVLLAVLFSWASCARANSDPGYTLIGTVSASAPALTYTDSTCPSTCLYEVVAIDQFAQASAPSNIVSQSPGPNGNVILTWQPSGGTDPIDHYNIYSLTTGGGVTLAPAISLSSSSVNFGNELDGSTTSGILTTLLNSGNATLTISSIAISGTNSGDFGKSTTCGATLASAASCTITTTFTPSAVGARSAAVTITDTLDGISGTISLSGTGLAAAPAVGFSVASHNFAGEPEGSTASGFVFTLTNTGSATLTISSIAVTGDFAYATTCGGTLTAASTCTITVTFTPTAIGNRSGTLTVTDTPDGVSGSAPVSGVGTNPVTGVGGGSILF
jgi:hypothetical protein